MQAIVGGLIECVPLCEPGLELWCNEEGMYNGLPLNRTFRAEPQRPPPGFEDAIIIKSDPDLADYGQPGVWRILGDFFLSRTDEEGALAPATDADMTWAMERFDGEDIEAAKVMNDWRVAQMLRAK